MFVLSTFLLFKFNSVCKLHNYMNMTRSRSLIYAFAQLSSEQIANLPSEPNVSGLHYIDHDL